MPTKKKQKKNNEVSSPDKNYFVQKCTWIEPKINSLSTGLLYQKNMQENLWKDTDDHLKKINVVYNQNYQDNKSLPKYILSIFIQ